MNIRQFLGLVLVAFFLTCQTGFAQEATEEFTAVADKPLDLTFRPLLGTDGPYQFKHAADEKQSEAWTARQLRMRLDPARILPCDEVRLDLNLWGFSHHTGDRSRKLQEHNRGAGLVASCGDWSGGLDSIVNSNDGRAQLQTILRRIPLVSYGSFTGGVKLGMLKMKYEVPQFGATLSGQDKVAYFYIERKGYHINLAPVPKMAGKAWIIWFTVPLTGLVI